MNPADFIQGLSASVAQYPLAALLVAVAGGALSTSVCPCTLPTGVGILGYVGGTVGGTVGGAASARADLLSPASSPRGPAAGARGSVPSRSAPSEAAPSGAALSLAFFVGLVAALTALGTGAAAAGHLLTRYDAAFSVLAGVVTGAVGVAAVAGPWVRRRVPEPDIRQRHCHVNAGRPRFSVGQHRATDVPRVYGPSTRPSARQKRRPWLVLALM